MLVNLNEKQDIKKGDIEDKIEKIVQQVEDGNIDALETFVQLKAIKEIAEKTMKEIQGDAITQFSKHGEKMVSQLGVETSVVAGIKAKLNYDQDGDVVRLTEELKNRKKTLDTAFDYYKKGMELVLDGEVVPVVDVKGYAPEFIKCSFKK